MKKIAVVAVCALALSCAGRMSQEVGTSGGESAPAFAVHAARLDENMIELSRMAAHQALDGQARMFAAGEVRDHGRHEGQLREIANARGWDLGDGADVLHRIDVDELQRFSVQDFDAAYMRIMIADHVEAVSAYRRYVRTGVDPELVAFARSSLPMLETHETAAEVANDWVQPASR